MDDDGDSLATTYEKKISIRYELGVLERERAGLCVEKVGGNTPKYLS
jgi:hypothetical protein